MIPIFAQQEFGPIQTGLIFVFLGIAILPVLAGIILWRKADVVSRWMWTETRETKRVRKQSVPNLFQIKKAALTFIGLFIFIGSLPGIISLIGNTIISWQQFAAITGGNLVFLEQVRLHDYMNFFALIVKIFVSLALITSPTRIIVFLDKVQNTWDLLIE